MDEELLISDVADPSLYEKTVMTVRSVKPDSPAIALMLVMFEMTLIT